MTIKRIDLQAATEAGVLQAGHVLQESCVFEATCGLDGGNRPKAEMAIRESGRSGASEFTGLRGFSRGAGGMMGWA